MNHAIILIFLLPFIGSIVTSFPQTKLQRSLGLAMAFPTVAAVVLLTIHVTEHGAQQYLVGGWLAPLGIKVVLTIVSRLALFAVLWVFLSAAYWKTPAFAILAVLAATVTSLFLWPAAGRHIRWMRTPALVVYFLRQSFSGGVDVAWRAFSPAMPLQPDFISYETTLGSEAGQVLLTWMISLMPGCASVNLENQNRLTIHVIDHTMYNTHDLRELERHIAAVMDSTGLADQRQRL